MITRAQVDVKHQDWLDNSETWVNTSLMYEGEPVIRKNAERFLVRRPKEDSALFQHRLNLFTYENHLGIGLGYYEAQMFDEQPDIVISPKDHTTGAPVPDGKLSTAQDQFYTQSFLKNCDGANTPYVDKYAKAFQYLGQFGAAWFLYDLPKADAPAQSLKAQQDARAFDPFLVLYTPLDIINWGVDERGSLTFAVVFVRKLETPFMGKAQWVDRWFHYDRTTYTVFEQRYDAQGTGTGSENKIQSLQESTPVIVVGSGPHAMAAYNRVPLQKIEFPQSWWLAKRAYSPARAHINSTNERRWALHMAALAVPVIYTEKEVSQIVVSEAAFLHLAPTDKFGFAEPNGESWKELAKEKAELKEEIFRAMYLIAMARTNSATAGAASGLSKQEDMAPNHAVLSGMGAIVRSAMQETLSAIIQVRAALPGFHEDENLTVDVRGFQFEDKLTVEEIDVIQTLLDMAIPSDLFDKELFSAAVRTFLKNGNPDLLAKIVAEIAAAPTRDEKAQQDMEQKAEMLRKNITSRLKDPVVAETGN